MIHRERSIVGLTAVFPVLIVGMRIDPSVAA
jgi:hypothetical protein